MSDEAGETSESAAYVKIDCTDPKSVWFYFGDLTKNSINIDKDHKYCKLCYNSNSNPKVKKM